MPLTQTWQGSDHPGIGLGASSLYALSAKQHPPETGLLLQTSTSCSTSVLLLTRLLLSSTLHNGEHLARLSNAGGCRHVITFDREVPYTLALTSARHTDVDGIYPAGPQS